MSDTNDDWASRTINELRAENERLRATPEMAGHTWCKLERALTAEAENERLRAERDEARQQRGEWAAALNGSGGFRARLVAAESRLATAVGLLGKRPKCVHAVVWERDVRAFLASTQPAAPYGTADESPGFNAAWKLGAPKPAAPARAEAEPESDWEREQRFWREHPVDRFDLEECGSGYMSYRDMQLNETGDWVRADDHRAAIERAELARREAAK